MPNTAAVAVAAGVAEEGAAADGQEAVVVAATAADGLVAVVAAAATGSKGAAAVAAATRWLAATRGRRRARRIEGRRIMVMRPTTSLGIGPAITAAGITATGAATGRARGVIGPGDGIGEAWAGAWDSASAWPRLACRSARLGAGDITHTGIRTGADRMPT